MVHAFIRVFVFLTNFLKVDNRKFEISDFENSFFIGLLIIGIDVEGKYREFVPLVVGKCAKKAYKEKSFLCVEASFFCLLFSVIPRVSLF